MNWKVEIGLLAQKSMLKIDKKARERIIKFIEKNLPYKTILEDWEKLYQEIFPNIGDIELVIIEL